MGLSETQDFSLTLDIVQYVELSRSCVSPNLNTIL